MNNIRLLDCTLRDGGYINQWRFGENAIEDITVKSLQSGSDIVELGFLRDVEYDKDVAVFNHISQVNELIAKAEKHADNRSEYAVMCEALNPLPAEKITHYKGEGVGIIRVIVWKRLLEEGFQYCKAITEKGYKLCVQPNRVEQYSYEEYRDMVIKFNEINPMAFYVVDSFGILDSPEIMKYADIADEFLKPEIAIGYHGHNNLGQAYGVAQDFIERKYNRTLMLDASVYGIGRGAGNLNIETIAKYMNEKMEYFYGIEYYLEIYEKYVAEIYKEEQWGYSPYYYLSALNRCNPMYANYMQKQGNISIAKANEIMQNLSEEDKIRFRKEVLL